MSLSLVCRVKECTHFEVVLVSCVQSTKPERDWMCGPIAETELGYIATKSDTKVASENAVS